MNAEDRLKIGEKDTDFNITGGDFTMTEERVKIISFSNPMYKTGNSLVNLNIISLLKYLFFLD